MNKEEFIRKYGEEAYEAKVRRRRESRKSRQGYKNELAGSAIWWSKNLEKIEEYAKGRNRPGGIYYDEILRKNKEGLRHERAKRRGRDGHKYREYKQIIDPEGLSQVHHSWYRGSAECSGIALVEKSQHQHGYIDVIQILEGEITLFTEAEIRER